MKKNKEILFSIITPTFNRAHLISKTIQSVLEQTYSNFELIIVDDGSTDNTKEIVNSFNDDRIKYYYKINEERSVARNYGIDKAKGEYISFLDDDDYYLPDFLMEFQTQVLNRNISNGIFMCDQIEIEINGNSVDSKHKKDYRTNPVRFILKYANNLQPLVISRDILEKEKFDSRFAIGEDFHLLFRVVLKYPFFYFPKKLCVYVNHEGMTMEKELESNLFIDLPYNRLDVLDYFFLEENKLLKKYNILKLLSARYNKISYFYASEALKKGNSAFALNTINKMKWRGGILKVLYYKLSIFVRSVYYNL